MTVNIKIAGAIYNIVLDQEIDIADIPIIGEEFESVSEAKISWGALCAGLEDQINKATLAVRTPAVYLVVASKVGWWVSREFLLATGIAGDAKLVKEEKYTMPYTEFISKCSKCVRLECQNYLAKLLEDKVVEQKKMVEQKSDASRLFPTQKKGNAVNFMLTELGADGTGSYVVNPPWLVNFIQVPMKEKTAQNLLMEVQENTLFVSFKREFYMNNREGCQKALEVIKTSCRGTKLEYGKMVAGRLPIKVRGTWKTSEI